MKYNFEKTVKFKYFDDLKTGRKPIKFDFYDRYKVSVKVIVLLSLKIYLWNLSSRLKIYQVNWD